jgi:tRNA nucleotidyltransferase (CCA-adding enzyme)
MTHKLEAESSVYFVESLMISPVEIMKPTDLVKSALRRMIKKDIGCMIVVEGGKPVGIITERDVSRKVAKTTKVLMSQVRTVMSRPLITVTPHTPIEKAVYLMVRYGIRRLPVIDGEALVGLISERDLLLRFAYSLRFPRGSIHGSGVRALSSENANRRLR